MPQKTAGGYISIVLIVLLGIFALFAYPYTFPASQKKAVQKTDIFCRPEIDNPNAPTLNMPTYYFDPVETITYTNAGPQPYRKFYINENDKQDYKLIKANVLVPINQFIDKYTARGDSAHVYAYEKGDYNGVRGEVYFPQSYEGKSYSFPGKNGQEVPFLEFAKYGILFLNHLDQNDTPQITDINGEQFTTIDIYQQKGKERLPDDVLQCQDTFTSRLPTPVPTGSIEPEPTNIASDQTYVADPTQNKSPKNDQLQLEWFLFNNQTVIRRAWWVPECKPAIYLYPKEKTLVNVKVNTSGFLTYTDPQYDSTKGWNVIASPDGKLTSINDIQSTIYDYLYYESKIPDVLIKKPSKGYVVKFAELPSLYKNILPKLGLNEAQTNDFITYWQKALNPAPYYFVGIMDPQNINQIEPLEITPKPDSINRVRLYFEALDQPKAIEKPDLPTTNDQRPMTNSLHVVEWGGMVKQDKDHPFTCSQ